MTVSTKKRIKKLVNSKTGVSQRKIANTLKISQSAVRKNIFKNGSEIQTQTMAPKEKQKQIDCQKIKYNALFIMIFSLVANFGDHPLCHVGVLQLRKCRFDLATVHLAKRQLTELK